MRGAAWRAVAVLALVAASAGTAGCSGGGPTISLGSCGVEGPDHPERCGTLEVPVDWAQPNGPRMSLQVVVVPAAGRDPAPDPLFYLAGFGGSAPANAQWPYDHLKTLEQRHDLVFVEQRGTGSTAETCDFPLPSVTDDAAYRDAVDTCLSSLARDPRHDTTPNAVKDLDLARQALGYEKVDLYGPSYGVSMGLAYLQAHPDRVRAAVLESGSLLSVRLWERGAVSAQHAFDDLVARCEADPACGPSHDPVSDLHTLVARLREQPVTVDLGSAGTQTITERAFLGGVVDGYLAQPSTAVLLPGDLAALVRGEWADVLTRRGLAAAAVAGDSAPMQVQELTLRCSDEWARLDPAAVAGESDSDFAGLTVADAAWQQRLCALWPHDEGVSGAVATDVPVLFVNGTADPADPPANVADATATMPNATLLTVPGGGHGVIDGCLIPLVEQFVETTAAPDDAAWQGCLDSSAAWRPTFPAS